MLELNKIYNTDYLEFLKSLDDNSIDSFITSPPYWQLRDYGFKGQIGLEPKYQDYIQKLIDMMTEMERALKPTGTIWINLGDTYARGSRNKKASNNQSLRSKHEFDIEPETKPNYQGLDKCLMLIPHRFAIRCVDELDLILRNDIIWAKRNGMPESVTDRFSKKHEFVFFFVKQTKYYFDLKSIKDKNKPDGRKDTMFKGSVKYKESGQTFAANGHERWNPDGKNPGDVSDFWDITTKPNKAKHYASFNSELIDKPIIAGCPVNGVICDPFCGTGTTLARAIQLDRQFIGNDGKLEYVEIANKRISEAKQQLKIFDMDDKTLKQIISWMNNGDGIEMNDLLRD